MSALSANAVVITRMPLYDHHGEIVPSGAMGTVVLVRVARSGYEDDTYEVELIGEGGRGRRLLTATSGELEVLSTPRAELGDAQRA